MYILSRNVVVLPYKRGSDITENDTSGYLGIKETKTVLFRKVAHWSRQYVVLQGSNIYFFHEKEVLRLLKMT